MIPTFDDYWASEWQPGRVAGALDAAFRELAAKAWEAGQRAPATWRPVSEPPELLEQPFGWPMSAPVLGFFVDGKIAVVTCERHDTNDKGLNWFTQDSERWNVTGRVTHWMQLPARPDAAGALPDCNCHACRSVRGDDRRLVKMMMVVCPVCGNKRCPKATNHRHRCAE